MSAWGLAGHALGRLELTLGQSRPRRVARSLAAIEHLRADRGAGLASAGGDRPARRPPGRARRGRPGGTRLGRRSGAHRRRHTEPSCRCSKARDRWRGAAGRLDPRATASTELGLTDRQAEVARLLTAGRTNAEIAAELQISASTVKPPRRGPSGAPRSASGAVQRSPPRCSAPAERQVQLAAAASSASVAPSAASRTCCPRRP